MASKMSFRAAILMAALCLFSSCVFADQVTSLFNTGVNASGTPLADGTIGDPHYTMVSAPGGQNTTIQVRNQNGEYPENPPWIGTDSLSAWIGPVGDTNLDGAAGAYDYRTTFNLTGFNLSSVVITGQWATDDSGLNILLNGVSTGITSSNGYTAWKSFTISSGFVAGVNTLDFQLNNGGGPTGLRVEMTGTGNEVPEPSSILLLASGIAGLATRIRRSL
jgi:hypothetical protein